MQNETYEQWLNRARRKVPIAHQRDLDLSEIEAADPSLREHFGVERVEVTKTRSDGTTWVRRGRVSVTTGWRPTLILMARVNSVGSSDVLGPNDKVTAVIKR